MKLKELALAATPGERTIHGPSSGQLGIRVQGKHISGFMAFVGVEWPNVYQNDEQRANAAFIAATSPDTVLELIALVERKEAEHLTTHSKLAAETLRADQGWQRYEEANADRNQLRAAKVEQAQPALTNAQINSAISAFEGAACTETYSVRAGVKAVLNFAAAPLQPALTDAPEWAPVTRAGQVKKGDKLRFNIGDKSYSEKVKQILHPGTDKEEVIYNKYQNFYFITSMAVSGKSSHKNVEVLSAPSQCAAPDERAAFEAWAETCDGNCNRTDLRKFDVRDPSHLIDGCVYINQLVDRDWIVWQARAALAAQPAKAEAPKVGTIGHTHTPSSAIGDAVVGILALESICSAHATPAPAMGEELPLPAAWRYQPKDGLKYPAYTEREAQALAYDTQPVALFTADQLRACMALRQPAAPSQRSATLCVSQFPTVPPAVMYCSLPEGTHDLYTAPPPAPVAAIVREALEATFEQRAGYLTKVSAAIRVISDAPSAPVGGA